MSLPPLTANKGLPTSPVTSGTVHVGLSRSLSQAPDAAKITQLLAQTAPIEVARQLYTDDAPDRVVYLSPKGVFNCAAGRERISFTRGIFATEDPEQIKVLDYHVGRGAITRVARAEPTDPA